MNADEWVVLELSPRSEGENPDAIHQAITKFVPQAKVFVPAITTHIGDDQVTHKLVDGYAFVQRVYPDSILFRLEGTRYVQGVLAKSGGSGRQRRPSIVRTADIDKMRRQIQHEIHQGIGIGDRVRITTGPYKNIEASVIEEIPETKTVQVHVCLRSKETIVTIPRSGLMVLDRSPLSPMLSKLTDARSWLRLMLPVLLWRPTVDLEALHQHQAQWESLNDHTQILRKFFSYSFFLDGFLGRSLVKAEEARKRVRLLSGWLDRSRMLWAFLASYTDSGLWGRIQEKYAALERVDRIQTRIQRLRRELDVLASQMSHQDGDTVVQNVLVDGNNMARRCFHAPDLSELRASNGQLTGVIVGMLRSLGSLRKRYPSAQLVVAWDGSSRRRKKVFGEYKAGRPPTPAGFPEQVAALQKILPTLGIRQVANPDEEADDLLATLVRGELSHQNNLIFSSDRDFLQLVSSTTSLLIPRAGIRKEVLFDEAAVLEHYGVPSTKMLQLRAFLGDDSDHIPGVARVPKKVLCSLVQAHGSVDGVYRSGLTGVSKGQYERLRSSEPQVRINLALMSLLDIPVSVTDPDVDADLATSLMQTFEIAPNDLLEVFLGRKTETPNV